MTRLLTLKAASDAGLARMYASLRTMRIVDGPDEVHNRTIARLEFNKYSPTLQNR